MEHPCGLVWVSRAAESRLQMPFVWDADGHWPDVFFVRFRSKAHAHHAWEVYKKGGRTTESLIRAVVSAGELLSTISALAENWIPIFPTSTGFQFTYTTLFGSYAAYLFICTGSIFPSITSHVFCNVMGLPNPVEAIHQWPQHKLGEFCWRLGHVNASPY